MANKLFRRIAMILMAIAASAGIAVFGGCGEYVATEPEEPGTETPGTVTEDPEDPSTDPTPVFSNYVNTSLTVLNLLKSTHYFEYEGELNAVRVQASAVPTEGTYLIINEVGRGDYDFAAGTTYKLTVIGSGLSNSVNCWNSTLQRCIDSFTIDSGTVEFTLTVSAAYIMIPLDSSVSTANINCTFTLTTT